VLGITPADVAKTLMVKIPEGYVRAVLPASERIDLRKLREARGSASKKKVHLASEEDLARDYAEFELGGVPPIAGARRDPVARGVRTGDRRPLARHRSGSHRHLRGLEEPSVASILEAGARSKLAVVPRLRPARLRRLLAGGILSDSNGDQPPTQAPPG
jgi:hypothetical protein